MNAGVGVSVLILTKNEERDLPGCLESVAWSDDIHLYDSYSDDRTVELAERAGARVTRRRFDNWAAHQNWGLANIPFKHPWVFYIDADERVSPELRDAILAAAADPGDRVAFRVRRRDFFMGTWLKHCQATPYYPRLFRPERIRYERLVNPVSIIDGPVAEIPGYLDHFPFSKGIDFWLERHNGYSTFEALQIIADEEQGAGFSLAAAFFERDFTRRRYHQKALFYRLPFRSLLKFMLLYVVRGGFLDGRPGYLYARMQAIYEQMIDLKLRVLRGREGAAWREGGSRSAGER